MEIIAKISSLAALSLAKLENAGSSVSPSRHSPRPRRANIDLLYSNEHDEDTIEIDQADQDRLLDEANRNCTLRILIANLTSSNQSRPGFRPTKPTAVHVVSLLS